MSYDEALARAASALSTLDLVRDHCERNVTAECGSALAKARADFEAAREEWKRAANDRQYRGGGWTW